MWGKSGLGVVRQAWIGLSGQGSFRFGRVGNGAQWIGKAGEVLLGTARPVRVLAWTGVAGKAALGESRFDTSMHGGPWITRKVRRI